MPDAAELGAVLKKYRVSTLWLTAALFNTVIDQEPQALSDVKQLLIGGEELSVPHVRKGLEQLSNTKIINGYGPTESTTFTCCYPIPRTLGDDVGFDSHRAADREHRSLHSRCPFKSGAHWCGGRALHWWRRSGARIFEST